MPVVPTARLEQFVATHRRVAVAALTAISAVGAIGLHATATGALPWLPAWPMLALAVVASLAAAQHANSRLAYTLPVLVGLWCVYEASRSGMLNV